MFNFKDSVAKRHRNFTHYILHFTLALAAFAAMGADIDKGALLTESVAAETYATPSDVLRIVSGTNVVFVIRNYNSHVSIPSLKVQQLDTNGVWQTFYDSKREHAQTLTNAMDYADAVATTRAPAAWSRTTSGLGAEAPTNTTWISTPTTVIAGGLEYAKTITSGGEVWVLASNGMTVDFDAASSNAFFRITSTTTGETVFDIEQVAAAVVYVNIADIEVDDTLVDVDLSTWTRSTHPQARVKTDLTAANWYLEEDYTNGLIPGVAQITWTGGAGSWHCEVENLSGGDRIFVGFFYQDDPYTIIKNNGRTDLSEGVWYNGTNYLPRVTGGKLEFYAQ